MSRKYNPFFAFICCVLAVPTCVGMLEGITAETPEAALTAGVLLGLAHVVLRPILRLLSAPIGCLTLGLAGFAIDIGLLYGCAYLVSGFEIENILFAALTAFFVNCVCLIAAGRK